MRAVQRTMAIGGLLLVFTGGTLFAQQPRKAISNPEPVYPELAKKVRLSGSVKVTVVIGTDGQIKDQQFQGGHPVLVDAVQTALKKWKYAPSGAETTMRLEFDFHP